MAFTTCASHGGKYSGGANTFFLRLVRGGDRIGGKLQVCGDCATGWMEYLARHFVKVSEGEMFVDYSSPAVCAGGGHDLGLREYQFYANAYPRGKAESQWYGRVCEECAPAIAEDLSLEKAAKR